MMTNQNTGVCSAVTLRLFTFAGVLAVLAGCAAGTGGVQSQSLRTSQHFVTERILNDIDFPTLQRNLFKHRAACGSAPRFVMHEGETGRASLIETDEIPESYEHVVLMDMVQYPESFRAANRIVLRVYSYYYNDDVQRRVDEMLGAVQSPGNCPATNPR